MYQELIILDSRYLLSESLARLTWKKVGPYMWVPTVFNRNRETMRFEAKLHCCFNTTEQQTMYVYVRWSVSCVQFSLVQKTSVEWWRFCCLGLSLEPPISPAISPSLDYTFIRRRSVFWCPRAFWKPADKNENISLHGYSSCPAFS